MDLLKRSSPYFSRVFCPGKRPILWWNPKSCFSGRGWGRQLFSFQSLRVHWMARASSLKCLSCGIPYQTFSLKNPFFTETCFVASPSDDPWQLTGEKCLRLNSTKLIRCPYLFPKSQDMPVRAQWWMSSSKEKLLKILLVRHVRWQCHLTQTEARDRNHSLKLLRYLAACWNDTWPEEAPVCPSKRPAALPMQAWLVMQRGVLIITSSVLRLLLVLLLAPTRQASLHALESWQPSKGPLILHGLLRPD